MQKCPQRRRHAVVMKSWSPYRAIKEFHIYSQKMAIYRVAWSRESLSHAETGIMAVRSQKHIKYIIYIIEVVLSNLLLESIG